MPKKRQNATDAKIPKTKTGKTVTRLKMRTGAGTYAEVIKILEAEAEVIVLGIEKDKDGNKWYKIQHEDGTGYCMSKYITNV